MYRAALVDMKEPGKALAGSHGVSHKQGGVATDGKIWRDRELLHVIVSCGLRCLLMPPSQPLSSYHRTRSDLGWRGVHSKLDPGSGHIVILQRSAQGPPSHCRWASAGCLRGFWRRGTGRT